MRAFTNREKRTIRFATIGLAIYLGLFVGYRGVASLETRRADYRRLVREAQDLKTEVNRYETKIAVVKKLMESFQLDPARLKRTSVVAEASAAIQKAATGGGLQLGPIRESPARPASGELATIQFEGTGPLPAALGLLHRLERLGYPVVIDSAQIAAEATRPGQVKLNLTLVILDFEQWQKEASHA
jgi:hypothetical protein